MSSHLRNGVVICISMLIWIYLYVPNPIASFLTFNGQAEPTNNDLLFLWIPVVLGAMAYVAHKGRWFVRFGMAIGVPILLLGIVFLLGLTGMISTEGAGWTLIALMLPMRAFVLALVVTILIVEGVSRLHERKPLNRVLP